MICPVENVAVGDTVFSKTNGMPYIVRSINAVRR